MNAKSAHHSHFIHYIRAEVTRETYLSRCYYSLIASSLEKLEEQSQSYLKVARLWHLLVLIAPRSAPRRGHWGRWRHFVPPASPMTPARSGARRVLKERKELLNSPGAVPLAITLTPVDVMILAHT